MTFSFGKNWRRFVASEITEERIQIGVCASGSISVSGGSRICSLTEASGPAAA